MLFIKNAYIKTMAGPDIECGSLLIKGKKIASVGTDIPCPKNSRVIDAGGRLVTPGFVEAHCHIGLDNEGYGWEGHDYNEAVDPITPQMRGIDSINPMDEAFENAVKSGVTTAITGPGSANVVGGTFAAIKLFGKRIDDMIIKNPVAMKVAFGENPKRVYSNKGKSPSTRMATAACLRELLFKTKRYYEDKLTAQNKGEKLPPFDMKLEAMIPVITREIPIKAHAHRADDIFTALRIAKEFDVRITLDHCTDGSLICRELKAEQVPVFIGPSLGHKSKIELANKSFRTPAVMDACDVKFSIITDAPVIPLQYLPLCAGLAVREGLDIEKAFRAITINPAEQTGIADRVGSIESGKDADIVIFNGNPLQDITCTVYMTIIDGHIVYKES